MREDVASNLVRMAGRPVSKDTVLAAVRRACAGDTRPTMDELAAEAGVSRATLYRLFPGKPVLLRELVRAYSPMEVIAETLEAMGDRPPSEVMPVLARNIAEAGSARVGLLRSLLFEVTGGTDDVDEAVSYALDR